MRQNRVTYKKNVSRERNNYRSRRLIPHIQDATHESANDAIVLRIFLDDRLFPLEVNVEDW